MDGSDGIEKSSRPDGTIRVCVCIRINESFSGSFIVSVVRREYCLHYILLGKSFRTAMFRLLRLFTDMGALYMVHLLSYTMQAHAREITFFFVSLLFCWSSSTTRKKSVLFFNERRTTSQIVKRELCRGETCVCRAWSGVSVKLWFSKLHYNQNQRGETKIANAQTFTLREDETGKKNSDFCYSYRRHRNCHAYAMNHVTQFTVSNALRLPPHTNNPRDDETHQTINCVDERTHKNNGTPERENVWNAREIVWFNV